MGKKGAGLKGSNRDDGPAWEEDAKHKSYTWSGAVTGATLWAPANGRRFIVTDYTIICGSASIVTVFDNSNSADNCLLNQASFAANGGISVTNLRTPFRGSAVDNILQITTGGGSGTITVLGYEE